jgi:hypothetical protein
MKLHGNARTCPNSRRLLVDRVVEHGWSVAGADAGPRAPPRGWMAGICGAVRSPAGARTVPLEPQSRPNGLRPSTTSTSFGANAIVRAGGERDVIRAAPSSHRQCDRATGGDAKMDATAWQMTGGNTSVLPANDRAVHAASVRFASFAGGVRRSLVSAASIGLPCLGGY